MARARLLKPGFFTNEELVELDFPSRLLFAGLWTLADREGRLEDRPKRIKMAIFPADNVDVDARLGLLAERGFLVRYAVGEARYVQIVNFSKHQTPHHREPESLIPAPEMASPEAASPPPQPVPSPSPAPVLPTASRAVTSIRLPETVTRDGEGGSRAHGHANGARPTNGAHPPSRAAPPPRLIPLPDPFEITDEMTDWVRSQKMPDRWAINRTESFVNHYDNGGKTLLSLEEWTNKWRRWLLDDWAKERASGLTAVR